MLTRCKKRSPQTLTVTFFIGFSVIHVSQGSVATYVRCGGISAQHCIANFLLSLPVKEFLKSVQIWQSYLLPKFVGLVFWDSLCCHLVSVGENVNYFIVLLSSSSRLVTVLVVLPPGECRWKCLFHCTTIIIITACDATGGAATWWMSVKIFHHCHFIASSEACTTTDRQSDRPFFVIDFWSYFVYDSVINQSIIYLNQAEAHKNRLDRQGSMRK